MGTQRGCGISVLEFFRQQQLKALNNLMLALL